MGPPLDDVIFDEAAAPPEAARWLALARVNTPKTYSQTWFYRNMRSAWDAAQEVKFKPLENNLYTVQFSCLGDWERVMNEGPWNFRGDAVILVPYDGISKPSTIRLDTLNIWVQIHDVPQLYAHLVKPLAAKVGEVLFVETNSLDFVGNFYRVWVQIDVNHPPKNAVSMIREGKRQIYRVKYEKLPDWCAVCGKLGHLYKEHGRWFLRILGPLGSCVQGGAQVRAEAAEEDDGEVGKVLEEGVLLLRLMKGTTTHNMSRLKKAIGRM